MSVIKTWFQTGSTHTPSWLPPQGIASTNPTSSTSRTPASSDYSSPRPSSVGSSRSPRHDAFATTERSEASVRRQLQSLLDTQAESLLAGIGQHAGKADDLGSSNSRSTSAARYGKVVPVRQPARRPISLRAARQGIAQGMQELAFIKQEEKSLCNAELEKSKTSFVRATNFQDRHAALLRETDNIRSVEGREKRDDLLSQDAVLQEQINAIEVQLARLKEEQSAVRRQLSQVTNSVESKLSSYAESVKLLERDMETFLRSQSTAPTLHDASYLSLPLERRTMTMARDHALEETESLESRQQRIKDDIEALKVGLTIWEETIQAITKFETSLREGTERLKRNPADDGDDDQSGMDQLLQSMDAVIEDVESKAQLADERGWKLLICCIGAELEALRQGRDMLRGVSRSPRYESADNDFDEVDSIASAASPAVERNNQFEATMRGSSATIRRFGDERQRHPSAAAHSDDEPDDDLLMTTRTDTDNETDE